jgi:hypothetical protein
MISILLNNPISLKRGINKQNNQHFLNIQGANCAQIMLKKSICTSIKNNADFI